MATPQQIENAAARRVGHLERIRQHIETHGFPPTLSELADAVDVDRETVKKDMRVLRDEGLIEFGNATDADGNRAATAPAGRAIRLVGHRVILVREDAAVTGASS